MKRVHIYQVLTLVPQWQTFVDTHLVEITRWVESFHEEWPCNQDNQVTVVCLLLEHIQQTVLSQLKQNIEAERKLMVTSTDDYPTTLKSQIEKVTVEIRQQKDWQFIITSSNTQLSNRILSKRIGVQLMDSLINIQAEQTLPEDTASLLTGLDKLVQDLGRIHLPLEERYSHLEKGWWQFFGQSVEEVFDCGNVLGKQAYVDWLKEEISREEQSKHTVVDVEMQKRVADWLSPLSGYFEGKKIMSAQLYNRVVEYTSHLATVGSIPDPIITVPRLSISNRHLVYSFYAAKKELRNIGKHKLAELLHTTFEQLQNTEIEVIHKSFASKPKTYDHDMAADNQ